MSKKVGIIIGVILIALIAGGIFGVMQMRKNQSSENKSLSGEQASKNSIRALMAAGQDTTCKTENGDVYISDKRVRADFSAKDDKNADTTSHLIMDDNYAYIWMDSSVQGTKININVFKGTDSTQSAQTQAAEFNRETDMQCSPWEMDRTKFLPPTNVTFADLSGAIQGVQTPTTPINNIQSSCDQMTDLAAKAACQKVVGY